MIRKIACVFSLLLLANALLYAQNAEIPLGRWNKVEAEKPSTGIVVTLRGGEVVECFLKSLSADMLTVMTDDGKDRILPKSAILRVVTREKRTGPLWDGAVTGAAIPGILGVIMCSAAGDERGTCWLVTTIWMGIGAGIGVGVDALYKGQITLYEAPEPRK